MNFSKFKRRNRPEVSAGSMADIAFLLLIFFLVTTSLDIDKGIKVKLPPFSDEELICNLPLRKRNVFAVKINTHDELLVRGEKSQVNNLRVKTKEFILNPDKKPSLSVSPRHAIISLQNDRGTSYKTYIAVYNELKAAYNEIWEHEAQERFNMYFKDLSIAQKRTIRKVYCLLLRTSACCRNGVDVYRSLRTSCCSYSFLRLV